MSKAILFREPSAKDRIVNKVLNWRETQVEERLDADAVTMVPTRKGVHYLFAIDGRIFRTPKNWIDAKAQRAYNKICQPLIDRRKVLPDLFKKGGEVQFCHALEEMEYVAYFGPDNVTDRENTNEHCD